MNENKKKFAYWLEPSLDKEIENMLHDANATSKSDFVRQAINFYMAFLRQSKSIDFISPLLAQTIKSQVESVEQNISGMLFKLAVEQEKVSNIIAWANKLKDIDLENLHEDCAKRVAETNGIISFEETYDYYQNGE